MTHDDSPPMEFTHVIPGDPLVPPDVVWDGHDDGDPLTPEQVQQLVEPADDADGADPDDPAPAAAAGTVAVAEDWLLAAPDRARELTDALRVGLLSRLRVLAAEGAAARTVGGRRPTASDLQPEATTMARAHGLLDDLAKVFTDLRRESASLLADAVADHLDKKSARVGTPDGGLVIVTTSAASSSVSVDEDVLLDVIGTSVIAAMMNHPDSETSYPGDAALAYADGVADGMAALRGVLGKSPGWTVSKLDALVLDLQRRDEPALAARLDGAYARVERGEPTAKISVEYGDGS